MPKPERLANDIATLAAHRLLRFVVSESWFQGKGGELPNIRVDGGYRGLARRLGLRSQKAAVKLKAAGVALSHLVVAMPTGGERLVSIQEHVVGRSSRLELKPLGVLAPHYIKTVKASGKRSRALVPLPPEMPTTTSTKTAARQASFHLLLLLHLRRQALELRDHRSLDLSTWIGEAAAEMDLSVDSGTELISTWSKAGPNRLLVRRGSQHTIASERPLLRDHLMQFATMSSRGAAKRARRRTNGAEKSGSDAN